MSEVTNEELFNNRSKSECDEMPRVPLGLIQAASFGALQFNLGNALPPKDEIAEPLLQKFAVSDHVALLSQLQGTILLVLVARCPPNLVFHLHCLNPVHRKREKHLSIQ